MHIPIILAVLIVLVIFGVIAVLAGGRGRL